MSAHVLDRLARHAIVPVVEIEDASHAVPLASALHDAGLPALEITLRTPAALDAIARVRAAVPEVLVGAGTIISTSSVDGAIAAGAQFGVAPGLGDATRQAIGRQWPMVPGVVTPSEITAALDLGLTHLKFFPAAVYGGVSALRSLSGPFSPAGVRFMPTGGVRADDAAEYLALPAVFAVGGTWIAPRAEISAGRWDAIGMRAAAAVGLVASLAQAAHA